MSLFASPGRAPEAGADLPLNPAASTYLHRWASYFLEYIPGLVLLVSLAMLARWLGRGGSDSYYVLYAILLGILVRGILGKIAAFEPGTRTYEVFWKAGIVLLGAQMGLRNFREVGFKGFGLAGFEVVFAISLTLFLTRIFRIIAPLRYLLAVGMGICGVSAVIALGAVLHTEEEDTAYAVSVILFFGLLSMSFLPIIGLHLHMDAFHFGLWTGLSVNNTAEAAATGFIYSDSAGHYSTIAKLCRNVFLDAALLYFVQRAIREKIQQSARLSLKAVWQHFPKFALGLLLFSSLSTLHFWPPGALTDLDHLYRWAFLLGFAGVGLRTDIGRLRLRGLKPLGLAFGIQSLILVLMLGCVVLIF